MKPALTRLPQILDAAAALFAAKAYQAASIRDIVKVAGMLPGSLYYHFTSKDELLVAVYAKVVISVQPGDVPAAARALIAGALTPARIAQDYIKLLKAELSV